MKKKPQTIPLLNFFAETLCGKHEESSLSQAEIARRCGIPAPHLTQMKQGKRRCFGVTPGMWMNLQLDYEFMRADREKGEAIRKEVQPWAAARNAGNVKDATSPENSACRHPSNL